MSGVIVMTQAGLSKKAFRLFIAGQGGPHTPEEAQTATA